ncbi:hypothetical protein [Microcoleus sp. CAWBG58]|uniref:hypothetical protein n=1 Tax=Microcoleus sp. CAWBG58 TaxID=2841651 RepID=UPI0025DCF70A|nr:hypothetical protein [Microcoleus sp. CAWBG58]
MRTSVLSHLRLNGKLKLPERMGLKPQAREKLKSGSSLLQSCSFFCQLSTKRAGPHHPPPLQTVN